jgi:hypothetical protein
MTPGAYPTKFFSKGCPGWGANPGSFDFVHLIPSATAAPPILTKVTNTGLLVFVIIYKDLKLMSLHICNLNQYFS